MHNSHPPVLVTLTPSHAFNITVHANQMTPFTRDQLIQPERTWNPIFQSSLTSSAAEAMLTR